MNNSKHLHLIIRKFSKKSIKKRPFENITKTEFVKSNTLYVPVRMAHLNNVSYIEKSPYTTIYNGKQYPRQIF